MNAVTIWDYKRFKHQEYPKSVTADLLVRQNKQVPLVGRSTPLTSMGSCFARNVALHLLEKGYNYLITEPPFEHASAGWDMVYNTSSMRQIFEYSLRDTWQPITRWWPRGEQLQDPYRRNVLYRKADANSAFEKHREASREALTRASVVILTLGLNEIWRDRRDGMTYYRVPSPRLYDPGIHEYHIQTTSECSDDLERMYRLLMEVNPEAHMIITVSPVPLFATFRTDVDVVSANTLSKATLRAAAEYFVQRHQNVHYFPSYELVMHALPAPWEKDGRHVTREAVKQVMASFEHLYVREQEERGA